MLNVGKMLFVENMVNLDKNGVDLESLLMLKFGLESDFEVIQNCYAGNLISHNFEGGQSHGCPKLTDMFFPDFSRFSRQNF